MPEGLQLEDLGYASDGSSQKYKCEGIAIDILSSGEQPEIVNGWRLAPIEGLIKAKYSYSQQKNPSAEKTPQ